MMQPSGHGGGDGEGEGETLMDTMVVPSHSSLYLSIPMAELESRNKGSGVVKASSEVKEPYRPMPSSDNLNPIILPHHSDDSPLVLGVPPLPKHGNFFRQDGQLIKIFVSVALVILVLGVVIPVAVIMHSWMSRKAEAKRIFDIRAFKQRSAFHFQPEKNWMNDPNGPMYYQGYYHLFYQYNPEGAVWGNIVWGHAVSTDLVYWRYLEQALQGDQWYDVKGVWSGSATFLTDGTPVLMYTGWSAAGFQTQNKAIPANKSDALLRQWIKVPENPFAVAPAGYNSSQFRDPTTAWQGSDGVWRLLIGANTGEGGKNGTALLFKSSDFRSWNFHQSLHSVPGTGMWECPDFYPVYVSSMLGAETSLNGPTVKHVLKVSANDKNHDYYSVGKYISDNDTFVPESALLDTGIGLRYDYGKFYASKSFYDQHKNRRILFGWVNESDSQEVDIHKGWASVMAIPRALWLDNQTTTDLIQWPVEELEGLRTTNSSFENVTLEAGSFTKLNNTAGNQLDIEVSFQRPNISQGLQPPELHAESGQLACSQREAGASRGIGPFGVYVLATLDFREQTAIYFQILQSPGEGLQILVCSDQSRSSVASNLDTEAFGSFVRIYETDEYLTLRILVDHSIVETFVQGGRTVITSRVYPELALGNAAHVFLFNNGTQNVSAHKITVWSMNSVQMTQIA